MTTSTKAGSACSLESQALRGAAPCCSSCAEPVSPVKAGGVAGAATASSAFAVIACGACCVLPLALPAVAASAAGGLLAWLARAHVGLTVFATLTVIASWLWVWRQSAKRRARAARSTWGLMGLATAVLLLALTWPYLEPALIAWFL